MNGPTNIIQEVNKDIIIHFTFSKIDKHDNILLFDKQLNSIISRQHKMNLAVLNHSVSCNLKFPVDTCGRVL